MINKDNVNNEEMNNRNTIGEIEIKEMEIEVKKEVAESKRSQFLPSKMMVMVRFLLGVYLIYTAYELINAIIMKEATNQIFNISFSILFVLAGILLLIFSTISLRTGKYIGGVLDKSIVKETAETIIEDEEINEKGGEK